MQLTRRRDKPLAEVSERELRRRLERAQLTIDGLPDVADGREALKLMPALEAASAERRAAAEELARREAERAAAERAERWEPARRALERAKRTAGQSAQARVLGEVAKLADTEVAGMTLVAGRLTEEEGAELLRLARRRIDGEEPLSEDEAARYELLVGRAAGDDELFATRRAERREEEKREALQAAERRHPQSESLVAAVLSDPDLFDGLQRRLRDDVKVLDELGREQQGATAVRIYEYDNIAALHAVVSLIVQNGGQPIKVGEHGVLPDGLPSLPAGSLAQLRRNGWIESEQAGTGMHVGLGPRVREIAKRWGIELPETPSDGRD